MQQSMVIEGWRDEDRKEGRTEGRLSALRDVLQLLGNTRLGTALPDKARQAVEAETDLARLEEWVKAAGTATSIEQVRDVILGHGANGA